MVRRSLIALGAAALAVPIVIGPVGAAGAAAPRVLLRGSMPLLPQGVVPQGAVPRGERISVQVQLKLRDQAGADALALAVSTPGNTQYHRYLTPDQFRARFSPTQAQVAKVSSWLTQQGLKVSGVPASRLYVSAEGTAAQVEAVFHTSLVTVESNGQQRRVNTPEPSIPADLAVDVDGITGLTQVLAHSNRVGAGDEIKRSTAGTSAAEAASPSGSADAPPIAGFRVAGPCSNFWDEKEATNLPPYGGGYPSPLPWATCGYKPSQLRDAYGTTKVVAGGIDGKGVTVAILDAFASPTIFSDASTYARRNDPSHPLKTSQFSQKAFRPFVMAGPNQCDASGWYGEETLDVEAVHAMAPGAQILFVGGKSCQNSDLDDALAWILDNDKADIVSMSFGNIGEIVPQADFDRTVRLHTQAAIEGIGLYYSSGDAGDNTNTPGFPAQFIPDPDFPASSDLATSVGGTSLGVDANGNVAVEHGWDTGISAFDPATGTYSPGRKGAFLYAAGGGASRLFGQPDYQQGVVPNDIARAIGAPKRRVSPDVGMDGDPNTGFLVGQTQTFPEGILYDEYRIGGTSLSAPLFAGVMALMDQKAGFHHGFANPFLYSLAGSAAFRDITPGPKIAVVRRNFTNGTDDSAGFTNPSVRTIDADLQTLRTLPGYDTLTGLGAPNGASFVNAG
jgi:subtilase family serine protease